MDYSVILIFVGCLITIAIVINHIQQQQLKMDRQRRQALAQQRAIIDETQVILAYSTELLLSDAVINILYTRLQTAYLQAIPLSKQPQKNNYKRALNDINTRIASLASRHHHSPSLSQFKQPNNEKQFRQLIQALSCLNIIVRNEYTKGKIEPATFNRENKRFEQLIIHIKIESLLFQAQEAYQSLRYDSAIQLLTKAKANIARLININARDIALQRKATKIKQMLVEIKAEAQLHIEAQQNAKQINPEIERLFEPKQKW